MQTLLNFFLENFLSHVVDVLFDGKNTIYLAKSYFPPPSTNINVVGRFLENF